MSGWKASCIWRPSALAALVLVLAGASLWRLDSARAQAGASTSAAEATPFANSREVLESMGVEESHLRLLVDGEPLDLGEQEPLLRVLYAVRKFALEDIERWAEPAGAMPELENSLAQRGTIYRLQGKVIEVTREEPLPEVVARFEMQHYYRCKVLLGTDETPVTVFALEVPKAWPMGEPISERVSCFGFFIKFAAEQEGGESRPAFATQRLAWHPEGFLGDAGMDLGLFDEVQNRSPIEARERECFYQLLAVVGRVPNEELLRLTQRPADDDYSVVPLFNEPEQQHGRLVGLTGTARRAILVRLDPQRERDVIQRLGFDHYYQIEIFTQDSQNNPLVFCVRELPEGMPEGPNIYETVRIPGVFFKTWAYRVSGSDDQPVKGKQLAPMLIGRQPVWIPRPSAGNSTSGLVLSSFFTLLLVVLVLAVWYWNRGDRIFRRRAIAKRYEPEQGRSLNDLDIEASQGPDFRGLP